MFSLLFAVTLLADPAPLPKLDAVLPKAARQELVVYRALAEVPEPQRAAAAAVDFSKYMLVTRTPDAAPVLASAKSRRVDGGVVVELPTAPSPCPPCSGIHPRPSWTPPIESDRPTVASPTLFQIPKSASKAFARAAMEPGGICQPCRAQ